MICGAALLLFSCRPTPPSSPPALEDSTTAVAQRRGSAATSLDPVGLKLLQTGKYSEAETYFRQLLANKPGNLSAREGLGTALCHQRKTEEALAEFSRVLEAAPNRPEAFLTRGMCYQAIGPDRHDLAVADLKKALELKPDNFSAHNQLGLIYQSQGKHPAAISEFNAAIGLSPREYVLYNNMAASLIAVGRYQEAISLIQKAIAMKPDLKGISFYNNLGLAFLHVGRYGEAEAAFLMETAINPGNLDAHLNLGNLYALSQRPSEAAIEYRRVLITNPQQREALINLGALYVNTGNHGAAIAPLVAAVSMYPNNPLAHHYLSLAYQAIGNQDRAQAEADAAQKLGYQPDAATWPTTKKDEATPPP
jgi:tetratricopeptide (TPR) repeat protein